jgi:RNA polymerase sigma factor (sigma-70 family)
MALMTSTQDPFTKTRRRDRRLVAACLDGDEDAWVELWQRYGPLVKSVARRVGCDADEAGEVLQRVALVAVQRLDQLRDPAKLPGWLAGTARFQALALIRARRPTEELHPWTSVDHSDPATMYQRDQELVMLRRAMLDLDDRCQRLIRRLDLEEPPATYQQVAESEGLSPTSVGPIRTRCLRRLRKIVESLSQVSPRAHLQGEG